MCPITSARDQRWWKTPWLVEKEIGFGICGVEKNLDDIDVDNDFGEDACEGEKIVCEVDVDDEGDDGIDDVRVASGELYHVATKLMISINPPTVNFVGQKKIIDPTVYFEG